MTAGQSPIDKDRLISETQGLFAKGYNCAEAMVFGFVSALDGDRNLVKLATPFGAGIGGRRDLCGILTGGELIIGSLYGRTDPEDYGQKQLAYEKSAAYYRWFKQEKRKIHCSEIVTGKFVGHTEDCVQLMDEAQAKLAEIIEESS